MPAVRNAPKLWPAEPSKRARTRPAGGTPPTAFAMAPPRRAPIARSAFVISYAASTSRAPVIAALPWARSSAPSRSPSCGTGSPT